jgi:hypothetical protein
VIVAVGVLANHGRCAIILNDEKAAAMKNRTHLFAYILLNILIASATTLTILWLWEQRNPRQTTPQDIVTPVSTIPGESETIDATSMVSEPIEPAMTFVNEDIDVLIRKVVGAGDLAMEYVEIYNQSPGPLDLSNWQLTDQEGQSFVFPALILNSEGAIKVYSKKGTNTVIELHWQADAPIWSSGETVTLLDDSDNRIATYSIP